MGVARAAVAGKGQRDLLGEAVQTLLASGQADRFGVWAEFAADCSGNASQINSFRGIVADQENDATPAEWSRLHASCKSAYAAGIPPDRSSHFGNRC